MRVLFEDNPKASISQLLLQVDKSLFFLVGTIILCVMLSLLIR